ncbi:MAG: hypothetical protein IJ680_01565 [Paludibacteraceae bacterium]|nr:hypothetical protein [Paludibacteraceae bacterium]
MIRFGHFADPHSDREPTQQELTHVGSSAVYPIPPVSVNKYGWTQNAGYWSDWSGIAEDPSERAESLSFSGLQHIEKHAADASVAVIF